MKKELFGMRRANGDWFSIEIEGQSRVLLFDTLIGAWRARAKNAELMLFWPAPIDDYALGNFALTDAERPASFWLIDDEDPASDLTVGHPLEYMQLATLEGISNVRSTNTRPVQRSAAAGSWVGLS